MSRVLLIGDSPLGDSPYINTYIEVFEKNNIPYDLIFWNRHLDATSLLPPNYIPYNRYTDNKYPFWRKALKIRGFARFANKWMKEKKYAYVVVFTIAHAVFMYPALRRFFKGRYIFDIRDYSPMCRINLLYEIIKKIIEDSAFTVISSAGFLRWLPQGDKYNYIIAHNTTIEMVEKFLEAKEKRVNYKFGDKISILTIGQISYYDSQVCFINHFANNKNVDLCYVGEGVASGPLQQYALQHNIKNVSFKGRYIKKDEISIVEPYHMMNIWLKHDINADSCMANRFYLSTQLRKPMIVSKGSFQGELCEKYGLGVVLEEKDAFEEKINDWWLGFDFEKYDKLCGVFLEDVKQDMEKFKQKVIQHYEENK